MQPSAPGRSLPLDLRAERTKDSSAKLHTTLLSKLMVACTILNSKFVDVSFWMGPYRKSRLKVGVALSPLLMLRSLVYQEPRRPKVFFYQNQTCKQQLPQAPEELLFLTDIASEKPFSKPDSLQQEKRLCRNGDPLHLKGNRAHLSQLLRLLFLQPDQFLLGLQP